VGVSKNKAIRPTYSYRLKINNPPPPCQANSWQNQEKIGGFPRKCMSSRRNRVFRPRRQEKTPRKFPVSKAFFDTILGYTTSVWCRCPRLASEGRERFSLSAKAPDGYSCEGRAISTEARDRSP
jgi:hypothetical protein